MGISGALSVIFGALRSHLLMGNIFQDNLINWDTAVMYQITHTLAILAITFMNRYIKRSYIEIIYYLFLIGIVFFSGSLYFNSISELTGISIGALKYITPLGGLLLIIDWIFIILAGITYKHKKRSH